MSASFNLSRKADLKAHYDKVWKTCILLKNLNKQTKRSIYPIYHVFTILSEKNVNNIELLYIGYMQM